MSNLVIFFQLPILCDVDHFFPFLQVFKQIFFLYLKYVLL